MNFQIVNLIKGSALVLLILSSLAIKAETQLSGEGFALTEKEALNLLNDSPKWQQIEAEKSRGELNLALLDEVFQTALTSSFNYITSEERQLNSFIPVTSPIKQFNLGVNRPTSYGATFGVRSQFEQTSNNFVHHNSTAVVGIQASLDLYRDFLGRLSRAGLERGSVSKQISQIQGTIAQDNLKMSLRKLYWSWVANKESQLLMQQLIGFSEKQVNEAVNRQSSNIADRGEVARYRSQLSSRKATLLSLEFQERMLLRTLKEILPQTADKKLQLAPYSLQATLGEVLSCTMYIGTQAKAPAEHGYYDDVYELLRTDAELQDKITSKHDAIDVKLQTEYRAIGKDFSYSDAWTDLSDEQRKGFQLGLMVNIPLGGKKGDTEDIKRKVEQGTTLNLARDQQSKLESMHAEVVNSLRLLKEVLSNQEENSRQLKISLETSRKKFQQARLTVQQLVQEQDGLLQSDLDVINTKLTVVHTLLEYFSVFPQTPCPLNNRNQL